jgi:hypothetical protein
MFEMRTDKLADLHARVAALKRKAAALGVPVRKWPAAAAIARSAPRWAIEPPEFTRLPRCGGEQRTVFLGERELSKLVAVGVFACQVHL